MRKNIIAIAILSALSIPAFAEVWPAPEGWQVKERIELTDGSFVNVYQDGKMAMECKYGHSQSMNTGHAMKARDGRTISMNGNETLRVELQNALLSLRN